MSLARCFPKSVSPRERDEENVPPEKSSASLPEATRGAISEGSRKPRLFAFMTRSRTGGIAGRCTETTFELRLLLYYRGLSCA